jgi:hypothetical protein
MTTIELKVEKPTKPKFLWCDLEVGGFFRWKNDCLYIKLNNNELEPKWTSSMERNCWNVSYKGPGYIHEGNVNDIQPVEKVTITLES